MVRKFTERQVVQSWQQLLAQTTELLTESGEWLRVVYPGRLNDGRGADFRDAVIATGRGLSRGDIEVHVSARGWQAHRHHQDPAYNRVVLHVVMRPDAGWATTLENGRSIPVVALNRQPGWNRDLVEESQPDFNGSHMPCRKTALSDEKALANLLDRAGDARFLAKAAKFESDPGNTGAGQALYAGIMGSLGYAKNKLPFLELARRVPLQTLESLVRDRTSDEDCLAQLQARLLGTAGLLPSQRRDKHLTKDDEWVDRLERLWAASHHAEAMSAGDWQLFRVRPSNSPARRIAAMSHLLLRHEDLPGETLRMVQQASDCRRLERELEVTTSGYWAGHTDFGSAVTDCPTLLGASRAADMIVNALLPFAFARGKMASQPKLGEQALDLYRHYPGLAANSVEKHMRQQLGLDSRLARSARRQQGLIHLYQTWCTQGRCPACPLSLLSG
ncbi:MAG: DUF2851 family protein [Chloroflexota bacterium]|nr:DUF2851 family protein [Chloroflexota bacterium]